MKRLCVGLVLAGMLVGGGARADDLKRDVQELLDHCKTPDASRWAHYCFGVIEGVGEMMSVNGLMLKNLRGSEADAIARLAICPPSGTSTGARVQVFKNWAEKHPEEWSQPYLIGVADSLHEVWPCPLPK
jgi:hypothetical protein